VRSARPRGPTRAVWLWPADHQRRIMGRSGFIRGRSAPVSAEKHRLCSFRSRWPVPAPRAGHKPAGPETIHPAWIYAIFALGAEISLISAGFLLSIRPPGVRIWWLLPPLVPFHLLRVKR